MTAPFSAYRLHGLKLSYFTRKLEGYLRVKGVPYEFVEMDLADFRECAKATGIAQMPQLQSPDGSWMTDTTEIISHFESYWPKPRLRPGPPAVAFASQFLEDFFDEWLWRPALYYRWAFDADSRLMSGQIADSLLRDQPGPRLLRRLFIKHRQQRTFLKGDGVNRATAPAVEALFHNVFDILEPVFAERDFLFGERPCEADFGLFGPVFAHFAYDPTPHAILRDEAPSVIAWSGRLWASRPDSFTDTTPIQRIPADLGPLFRVAAVQYLPYLSANAAAFLAGKDRFSVVIEDTGWDLPVSPYRVRCLNRLRQGFQALAEPAQRVIGLLLGEALPVIAAEPGPDPRAPVLDSPKALDRQWREV
jgi:glutathione S-transferase